MAEVKEQNAQNPVMVEIARRKRIQEAQAAQPGADQIHRANLGLPPVGTAPQIPRHIELADQVTAELAGKSVEEFVALRRKGELSDAVKEAMAVVPPPKRDELQLAEFTNADRRLIAPPFTHPMVLDCNSKFWSSISDQLQMYDLVRVIAPDRSWFAQFVVTSCGENSAEARLIHYLFIDPPQAQTTYDWLPSTHELIAVGPESKLPGFAIRRIHDSFLMMNTDLPFKTVEEARRYWKDHAVNRRDQVPQYFP